MACCVSLGSATFTTSQFTCLRPRTIVDIKPIANTMLCQPCCIYLTLYGCQHGLRLTRSPLQMSGTPMAQGYRRQLGRDSYLCASAVQARDMDHLTLIM